MVFRKEDQDTWVVPLQAVGGYLNSFLFIKLKLTNIFEEEEGGSLKLT